MTHSQTINLSGIAKATNDIYLSSYKETSRYLVLYGGAGSGKSIFTAYKLMHRIITQDNHRFLIVRKVARTLRQSVFQLFIELITKWKLSAFFKINKTDMTIEFIPNGSKLLFFGLDDVEKLKSIQGITGVWIEEASETSLDDFTQLDLRLRGKLDHYKQIILSFNPVTSNHWLKRRFFDKKDPQAYVLHSTYLDNRFLDAQYIGVLNELKNTNFSYYEIYALGKWGSLEGVVYKNWDIVERMPIDCETIKWGQDFGFNNPSATVLIGIVGAHVYVQELIYESHLTNSDLITRLKHEHPVLLTKQGFLDSAEPARIQEFRNAGFNVMPAIKEVKAGIDKVKSYQIHIINGSQNLINEFELYCWKLNKNKEPLDEPVKQHDHALDALRYALFQGNTQNLNTLSFKIGGL